MNTDQLMDKLIKAVSFKFREDKTSPGITVSALKKGYYCSVVRYPGAFARDKKVVCNVKAATLPAALKELTTKFLCLSPAVKDPIEELKDLVSKPEWTKP